ncbi:hypothetical protein OR16_19131 [Cupriavidus basilensis OR16]|uniref:Uncharacterized protein n=1 Tax=Cupriavidus basilensis OR16 TaxID=1127483 RepID=H1S7B9_9BURK|nr:hypothetical protein [Cupriavidus basilensis]EHP41644.1 hypothetical protein OR16_19131 [Cupriavidus basilensis OR16]
MIDLIGAVALGAASALVVFVYIHWLAFSNGRRGAVAGVIGAWFALVVACGATGVLGAAHGIGPAGLGIAVLLPLAVFSYFSMRTGMLGEALGAIPLPVLIGVHAMRLLGVFFVLLFWEGRLPAPFAPAAGWGDMLIGATALPVAYLAATRAPAWRTVTLVWNALGLFDLADAIALGAASAPGVPFGLGSQGANSDPMTMLPWILIPCFIVPLLAHSHLLIFQRLRRSGAASEQAQPVSQPYRN